MAKREEWIQNKKRNFESGIANIVDSVVRPAVTKFSKIEADLVLNWNSIFDTGLSKKIIFDKVVFTSKKDNRFILYVKTRAEDFLETSYSTQIIAEQLNIYLGYPGTEKVKVSKLG